MEPRDRLQLVGHGGSPNKLLANRIDLLDAFDDYRIDVEMVPNIEDVDADIVVIASSVSASRDLTSRRQLGLSNLPIFEELAEKCASSAPNAFYIVISNPTELAIEILSSKIDRRRVMGMGAQQDSLRFARAIAKDLDINRNRVRASVLGEHGPFMVPLWSRVGIRNASPLLLEAFEELRQRSLITPLSQRVAELQSQVMSLLNANKMAEAYEATRRALPDARIMVEPVITFHSMRSTPNATANATISCLAALLASDRREVHGQVMLEGEFLGIHGVCGVPLMLDQEYWRVGLIDSMEESEKAAVLEAADSIRTFSEETIAKSLHESSYATTSA
jgi:malate dehydrogenase